jgi:hypothetical protein
MNSAIKVGILAGGAWLLYQWWQQQQLSAVPGSIPNAALPAPTPGPLTAPASSSAPPASLTAIRSQLQTLANNFLAANPGVTGLDVDQWSNLYSQIRGVPFPDWPNQAILQALGIPLTVPGRSKTISIDQWMNAAGAAGLSGYRRRGLDAPAPYLQLRNRAKVIRLPLTTPAVAAIRRGVAVARSRAGRNYLPSNTPMTRGAA